MKVFKFFILFILILFDLIYANSEESKHSIIVDASYLITSGEKDLKNTVGFGFLYNYKFTKIFYLETGLYYFSPTNEANILPSGNFKILPLIINGIYIFKRESFNPYISGGISYFILNYSLSSDMIDAFNELGFDLNASADNAVGVDIGGGISFELNPKYDLIFDIRYYIANSSILTSIQDRITKIKNEKSTDISLNSLTINGGIKFNF